MANSPAISDTQAEAGIIATLIYNPTFCLHSEQLKPNHFYNKDSSCLYWAICQLAKKGINNIDSFNLTGMLNSNEGIRSMFEKYSINVDNYIDMAKTVARDTLEEYKILVSRVMALAFKRALHKKLQYFDSMCIDINDDDIHELSGNIYNAVSQLNEQYVLNDKVRLIGEVLDDIWDEIQQRSSKGIVGLKPKIPLLSSYFTYEPGELVLLQARMKQGKSAYMLNEAIYQLKCGNRVAYFDTEMPSRQFVERALAHLSGIPVRKIKDGSYTVTEEELLKEAMGWLRKQKFVHMYKPAWSTESIYATAKILQHKMDMNFLIFDYLKDNTGNAAELANKLGEKADHLKNFVAGGLNIPVLAAAQLGRSGEVADSDKLDRYTSVSVKWMRKAKDEIEGDWLKTGNYKMNVKFNRLGELQDEDEWIDVVFNGNIMDIHQAEIQHEHMEL